MLFLREKDAEIAVFTEFAKELQEPTMAKTKPGHSAKSATAGNDKVIAQQRIRCHCRPRC
jgi:hypothetical protein